MALDGLNAAAAVAILNNAGVASDVKARGVVLAAFTPGLLGIAVPIVMANQAKAASDGTTTTTAPPAVAGTPTPALPPTPATPPAPTTIVVPNVSARDLTADQATKILNGERLGAVTQQTYDAHGKPGLVIQQDPVAGTRVPLDSSVTIIVNAGPPPAVPVVVDVDADLTKKMADLKSDFDQKLDDVNESLVEIQGMLANLVSAAAKPPTIHPEKK